MWNLPKAIKVKGQFICPKCEQVLVLMPNTIHLNCMSCQQLYLMPDDNNK